jgi:TolB protein
MIWQRNNETLDIYDAGKSKAIKVLSQAPGFIQAPSWSPIDDRWLIGILNADKRSTDLAIITEKEAQILAAQLTGPVSAAWSPNGNYVAYTDRRGPLIILDANTGKTIARSSVTGVLAFFWSPNSEHIAYVTLATSPGSFSANGKTGTKVAAYLQETTRLAWSVIDIPTGSTRRYGSWLPTREMVYLLSFFDQFSQSHRIWSPDSRYLVFSETNANNRSSISLLDTTQADSVPLSIADGLIAIWSYN